MEVVHTTDIKDSAVNGHPDILKKVFVDRGKVPHLMNFSFATFKSGQGVELHAHQTMYEVFYVLEGRAIFECEGEEKEVRVGDCITIPHGKMHRQYNPFDDDVTWLYFGVATD